MRMYVTNQKYFMFILFIFLLVFSMVDITHALPVCDRTTQVREAIVTAADVAFCSDVTDAHLAAITTLDLTEGIETLKNGDFDGLSALTTLSLNSNGLTWLPQDVFAGLTALTNLSLDGNLFTWLYPDVFDGLSALTSLSLDNTPLTWLPANIFGGLDKLTSLSLDDNGLTWLPAFDGLSALTSLSLGGNEFIWLPADVFAGLSALTSLSLDSNALTWLPNGVFDGLTALTTLSVVRVDEETTGPLWTTISLEKVGAGQFKATASTGAPFDIALPISVTNGNISTGVSTITIPTGSLESTPLTVARTAGTSVAVTVDIGTLPSIPSNHQGYVLARHENLPLEVIGESVNVPVFTEGENTTRSIAENTTVGIAIGTPVSATDADDDPLTYSLGGTDAASFDIVSTTGQLQTKAALDYETKNAYSVTISVSDGNGGSDTITVTINIDDVNEAPMFTDGDSTIRFVAEDKPTNRKFDTPVAATDADGDTLTYSLGGTDASSFRIVSTTGRLKTKASLDYETKSSYMVTITASDDSLANTIAVTINITDVNEAPVFADGSTTTREIAENTAANENIGTSVSADDPENNTLTYSLSGTDAASFDIVSTSGQLQTKDTLDYETKQSYSVTITVSDGDTLDSLSDTITVTITVTDVNDAPVFTDHGTTTRSIAENTLGSIGSAVAATDEDADDTLTYSLSGTDAASFDIDTTSGQLQTNAALDYENKPSYTVTITVSDDGNLSNTITVTINITNVNEAPVFTDGENTTRAIAENTATDVAIEDPVEATDQENDTLTYTLSGIDAASFSIVSTSGQLQTNAALDYETKNAYSVTVSVSDGTLTDTINVTINVTDVAENRAPVFTEGEDTTRAIAENTAAGVNIGSAVSATDQENDILTYSLSGTDAASFDIVSTSGQLQTNAALDYETKQSYSVTISVSDGTLTDTINVTINVTDVAENRAPVFTEGEDTTRAIAENTATDADIGAVVAATDDADDTLTYTLSGTNASSFSIVSTSGQLRTRAALNYEAKSSYSVTITVSDGTLSDTITVTINVTNVNEAPVFTNGSSTTRTVAENTASSTNIGSAVSATDVDVGTTLTYTLGGTNAASFSIVSTSGQLKTKAALDYETKQSYSVTINVSDGTLTDTITVTITVTNVNDVAPVFTDGENTTRAIAENTATDADIEDPVEATDQENDTLTYSLGGTDAASFSIVSTSGQLKTKAALDHESKSSYSVTVSVSDGNGGSDSITVRINVTDVNEAPVFDDGATTTRWIDENVGGSQGGTITVSATDEDVGDTLRYTLSGTDAALFSIDNTGQLSTTTYIDYESTPYYYVTATVSDGDLSDSIDVTIEVSNVNEAPVFTEGSSTTRTIAENTGGGADVGSAVSATDEDSHSLTYSLGGTDASSFDIVSTSGQLRTTTALNYETKRAYTVSITVSDVYSSSDTIDVTINVTNVNDVPVFTEGSSTTRTIAENTASGVSISSAVSATDEDSNTLRYRLIGTDAAAFSIVSTSGQLQTKAALDYETKSSYSVSITVSDGYWLNTINVTINVRNANDAPVFTEGSSTTRSVVENTAPYVNFGSAVSATDVDGDRLTYRFSGYVYSFSVGSSNGQLRTYGSLDYETNSSYSVSITASDGNGGSATINVTINIIDIVVTPAISDRTPAVRDAIIEAAGVSSTGYVTEVELASITSLYISGNSISALKAGDFNGMTGLTNFNLSSNRLSSLPSGIFDDLTALTSLDLASNRLSSLPSGIFDDLTALTSLHLSGNPLSSLSSDIFDDLTALTTLNLDTQLSSFPSGIFDDLTALRYFNMSSTQLSSLSSDIFDDLTALRSLNLSNTQLSSLPSGIFDNQTALYHFSLSSTQLSSLPSGIFDNQTALSTLSLSSPQLSSLPSGVFANLTTLTTLNLSNNQLSSLPSGVFANLTTLTTLNLSNTQLSSLPSGVFTNLTALEYLYLTNNAVNPLPFNVSLEKVSSGRVKAVAPAGAPFDIVLPLSVTNGSISGGSSSITISKGSTKSSSLTVSRTAGTTAAVTVDIGTLPGLPSNHSGYALVKSGTLPLEVISAIGGAPAQVSNDNPQVPDATSVLPNYPNPSNPETWIPYQLAKPAKVTFTIYNTRGVVVRRLSLGHQLTGFYHNRSRAAYWDGKNESGESVASGIYFYTFAADDFTATRKILIRK